MNYKKYIENTASFGLLLVAVSLVVPFATITNTVFLQAFKWVYLAGAVIFFAARVVGATDKEGSMRLRRLRRLEAWAGVAFGAAAFFWFYNESRFPSEAVGALTILRDTITFTLVGALIQIIAGALISRQAKK